MVSSCRCGKLIIVSLRFEILVCYCFYWNSFRFREDSPCFITKGQMTAVLFIYWTDETTYGVFISSHNIFYAVFVESQAPLWLVFWRQVWEDNMLQDWWLVDWLVKMLTRWTEEEARRMHGLRTWDCDLQETLGRFTAKCEVVGMRVIRSTTADAKGAMLCVLSSRHHEIKAKTFVPYSFFDSNVLSVQQTHPAIPKLLEGTAHKHMHQSTMICTLSLDKVK